MGNQSKVPAKRCVQSTPNNLFCQFPILDNFFWHYPWLALENPEIAIAWESPSDGMWVLEGKEGKKMNKSIFYQMGSVLSCPPFLCPVENGTSVHRGCELSSCGIKWLFTERRQGSLLLTPILFNLGHYAKGNDVSANIYSLVQNISPSCIVLASIVNLWVDFRPK